MGTTMEDLVAFVAGHPGLTVQPPTTTTIDGHPATIVERGTELAPTWTRGCPELGVPEPVIPLLTEARQRDHYIWGPTLGTDGLPNPTRLVFVDLGDGQVVSISDTSSATAAGFDAFVGEAMPIVESMHFTP